MATQYTGQGLPYQDHNALVNDVPDYIKDLAQALDKRIVGVYADPAAVSAAGSFPEGSLIWVQSTDTLQVWTGSEWKAVFPSSPRIFSGTTVPASNLGSVGDLYIRY